MPTTSRQNGRRRPWIGRLRDQDAVSKVPHKPRAVVLVVVASRPPKAHRGALIGKIGENVSIRRFVRYETANKLTSYLHGTRIGVIVEYDGGDEQVGKDVAMHIAAMKPVSL